jgi:hypothetical protein
MKGRPEKLEGTNEPKRRQTLSYEWDTARGKAMITKETKSAPRQIAHVACLAERRKDSGPTQIGGRGSWESQ